MERGKLEIMCAAGQAWQPCGDDSARLSIRPARTGSRTTSSAMMISSTITPNNVHVCATCLWPVSGLIWCQLQEQRGDLRVSSEFPALMARDVDQGAADWRSC